MSRSIERKRKREELKSSVPSFSAEVRDYCGMIEEILR